jgi:hypothetical protein
VSPSWTVLGFPQGSERQISDPLHLIYPSISSPSSWPSAFNLPLHDNLLKVLFVSPYNMSEELEHSFVDKGRKTVRYFQFFHD